MPFCGPENISVSHVGIKLGVTFNDIPKVDFAIALCRILAHIRTPYGDNLFAIPVGKYGYGPKRTLKVFSKVLMKISTIHTTHIKYKVSQKFPPLVEQWYGKRS
jgi:hypothetical protein